MDGPWLEYRQGQEIFILRKYLDWAWELLNLLLNGYWGSCTGIKRLGRDADHSPSFSAEVKNEWSYTSTSPVCLHGVDRNTFTLFTFKIFPHSQDLVRSFGINFQFQRLQFQIGSI